MQTLEKEAVQKDINRSARNLMTEQEIKEMFESFPKETVRSACFRFRSNVEVEMEAEGSSFE